MSNRAVASVPRHSSGRLLQSLLPTSHRDADHLYLISPFLAQYFYLISSSIQVVRSLRIKKRNHSFNIFNYQIGYSPIVFRALYFTSTTGRAKPRIRATIMGFFQSIWHRLIQAVDKVLNSSGQTKRLSLLERLPVELLWSISDLLFPKDILCLALCSSLIFVALSRQTSNIKLPEAKGKLSFL
jgi:hypothetical protein